MRLVRNAIIYLVAFIDQQERLKRHDATGVALPLLAFAYRHYPIRPQDSPTQ